MTNGISIGNKRLVHFYHHYIMGVSVDEFQKLCKEPLTCKLISEEDLVIIERGDFAIANMRKYLTNDKEYAEGYLFFIDGEPVGYLWIVKKGGNELSYKIKTFDAFLSCVCVFKEYRGRNIANGMIEYIVKKMRANSMTSLGLGVNTDNAPAIAAYIKAGFSVIAERKYPRVFRKNLPYYSI